jgi:hypothetical protein
LFGITKTLPRAGYLAKLSKMGEKGQVQGGDQEPNGHSERVPLWRWKTFQKDHSTNQAFLVEWPDEAWWWQHLTVGMFFSGILL